MEATQNVISGMSPVLKNYLMDLEVRAVATPEGQWLTRGPRVLLKADQLFLSWVVTQ